MNSSIKAIEPGVWYEDGTVYYYMTRLAEKCSVRDTAQILIQGPSLAILFPEGARDDRSKLMIELEMMLTISSNVTKFLRPLVKGRAIRKRVELLD